MQSALQASKIDAVKLVNLDSLLFLLIQQNKEQRYLSVPATLDCKYSLKSDEVLFTGDSKEPSFIPPFNILNNYRKSLFGKFKRKARLKGLGYKCELSSRNNSRYLQFKIGNSHHTGLYVPHHVKSFNITKTSVSFDSADKIASGNYLQKIYIIKPADCYKRKGLEKSNSRTRLKPVNKK